MAPSCASIMGPPCVPYLRQHHGLQEALVEGLQQDAADLNVASESLRAHGTRHMAHVSTMYARWGMTPAA